MSSFIIGVGGTGAKCIESIVHLAACGLLPRDTIRVLFVDPDKSNGSLERAANTLETYRKCHEVKYGDTPLFQTKILTGNNSETWSPFTGVVDTQKNLSVLYNTASMNPQLRNVLDVLFSPIEQTESLDDGFLGHPSIGSAFMASIESLDRVDPWQTFIGDLRREAKSGYHPRVFFVGSIFGGTGASGVPTLARLLRNSFEEGIRDNIRIIACMILPYFTFPKPDGNMVANPENFSLNTQAALQYYHNQNDVGLFNAVYLLGDPNQTSVTGAPRKGGKEQKNAPHFIELYAALAARDAFTLDDASFGDECKHCVIARRRSDELHWNDLPEGVEVRHLIGKFTRFSFAYRSMFQPMIDDIRTNGRSFRAPWHGIYLRGSDNSFSEDRQHITDFTNLFLLWLGEIHRSGDKVRIDLVDWRAFASETKPDSDVSVLNLIDSDKLSSLRVRDMIRPVDDTGEGIGDGPKIKNVWSFACSRTLKDSDADGYGRFIRTIYDACSS